MPLSLDPSIAASDARTADTSRASLDCSSLCCAQALVERDWALVAASKCCVQTCEERNGQLSRLRSCLNARALLPHQSNQRLDGSAVRNDTSMRRHEWRQGGGLRRRRFFEEHDARPQHTALLRAYVWATRDVQSHSLSQNFVQACKRALSWFLLRSAGGLSSDRSSSTSSPAVNYVTAGGRAPAVTFWRPGPPVPPSIAEQSGSAPWSCPSW